MKMCISCEHHEYLRKVSCISSVSGFPLNVELLEDPHISPYLGTNSGFGIFQVFTPALLKGDRGPNEKALGIFNERNATVVDRRALTQVKLSLCVPTAVR
jgi:hypothetical protein